MEKILGQGGFERAKGKQGLIFLQSLFGDTVQELRFCDVATSKDFER
jgi:hypothetical protein